MVDGAKKNLGWCTYTGEKRNWTFDKYATFYEDQNNTIEIFMEHGYTGIDKR